MTDQQDDFGAALRRTLDGNAELDDIRGRAEVEMDRIQAEREAAEARRAREADERREQRHAQLVEHLETLLRQLVSGAGERVDARAGWSESGEEYLATITTVGLQPKRSLFIELDRDDDEVLVRWRSAVGDSIEMWRLHEVDGELIQTLVLQVIDEQLWSGRTDPPPFPGHEGH